MNHWTSSRDAGDLPGDFHVLHDTRVGDEGTALSEIVYDLAPGASLYFNDFGSSPDESYNRIQELKDAGCKVVVDDFYWLSEPALQDGAVAVGVEDAAAAGVTYVSACGNQGARTWDGFSSDADSDNWIEFQATDETNRITVAAHDELRVTLQWANRYNMAWEDYDLYAFAGSSPESPVIASGTSSHPRPDEYGIAYEYVSIPNNTDSPLTCYLRVKHIRGYMPREIKLLAFGSSGSSSLQYVTDGGIIGHAAAASCISVAAINANTPETVASYSSHGPSRIYSYSAYGTPISFVDRSAPADVWN